MDVKTRKGIYYWSTYRRAYAYAQSVGVTLYSAGAWPRAVYYEKGWAIQLRQSGPYLGPKHVKIIEGGSE
jgi:hypothetical protein